MSYKFNPFTGNFDDIGATGSGGTSSLTEYDNADKPSPSAGDVWVKHTTATGAGSPVGLLLALTAPGSGTEMYELSYRTSAGTTKRIELT
jgi:hypothetical protein